MTEPKPEPPSHHRIWSPRRAVDLATLDDSRLVDYRHPDEWRALVSIGLVLLAFLGVLALLRPSVPDLLRWVPFMLLRSVLDALHPTRLLPILLLLFFGFAALEVVGVALRLYDLPYDGVEITPESSPELGPVVEELTRRFDMPGTRVFSTHSAPLSGIALGFRAPYLIAFPADLLGFVTADEFRFVLGRQLGHAKLGHTRMSLFFGSSRMGLTHSTLRQLRSLVFGNYQRAQELSADRIGLLATRSLAPALSLLVKIQAGDARWKKIDLESLAPRAAELSGGRGGWLARQRQLLTAEPRFIVRLLELTRWAGLPHEHAGTGLAAPTSRGAAGDGRPCADEAPASSGTTPTRTAPPPSAVASIWRRPVPPANSLARAADRRRRGEED
jgi:Zn-dependent protease with chaperone function